MAKRLPVMGGAVWHDDPCLIYCQGNQISAKSDKPQLTGGAGKLCATLKPGQTAKGVEFNGIVYDLHRYENFSAVPQDMQRVLGEGVHAREDGAYCAMLKAYKAAMDNQYKQDADTARACEKLCSKAGAFSRSYKAFKESICKDMSCRDETWRNEVFQLKK
mmetsp:Transcript_33781/g.85543  ORF Transcript_33781/g.85543 Transcript_33781/m.85543 type:complete len:161 (-) Transcript_33781:385-867(-)|eukprot:CAMPEP_0202858182 /NCGR_PEP_ID=MMETSP1391-20130828/823_1 /ASSEMBLY_ACC=CAM_ASM_000867 /TAXON_ID=1034604 /ORGANISM="Chlamydomonas leiostraca, Strain SAG 11-49" /LENGTH=160 /DNA_ID=CAMNT_0049537069 /DNA_START=114 /DNA_END=596 /DNA_ORIENTATION=+